MMKKFCNFTLCLIMLGGLLTISFSEALNGWVSESTPLKMAEFYYTPPG